MTTITFDTLKFVQTLRESGVNDKQAEAIAAAVRDAHVSTDAATKQDLRELELRLKHDLTLRLGGMLVAAVGIVAAIVKLL